MVKFLVENGANVNIVELRYGYTPFHLSIVMRMLFWIYYFVEDKRVKLVHVSMHLYKLYV